MLLAVCPPFFVWGTSGLEGMAHAFTWTLAFYALGPASARWAPALGAVALLASMLLRAEGFAWGGGVPGRLTSLRDEVLGEEVIGTRLASGLTW